MTSPWTGEELIQTIGRAIRIAETVPQEEGVDREKQLVIINGFSKVASRSMGRDGRAVMRVGLHKALFDDPVVKAAFGESPPFRRRDSCRLLESGTRPGVLMKTVRASRSVACEWRRLAQQVWGSNG